MLHLTLIDKPAELGAKSSGTGTTYARITINVSCVRAQRFSCQFQRTKGTNDNQIRKTEVLLRKGQKRR